MAIVHFILNAEKPNTAPGSCYSVIMWICDLRGVDGHIYTENNSYLLQRVLSQYRYSY